MPPPISLRVPSRTGTSVEVARGLMGCAWGCVDLEWKLPPWLWKHQEQAAKRIAGSLTTFGGAILGDAVGLGKTYVALALATRYRGVILVTPAALKSQWTTLADKLGVAITPITHEALSRGAELPEATLVMVDEAHRFRNPATKRYDQLARGIGVADLLLITATPVVNRITDLTSLLSLFLPDNGLASSGLPCFSQESEAEELVVAVRPLFVARSSDSLAMRCALPAAEDRLFSEPTTAPEVEYRIVGLIEDLQFPNFGAPAARKLLKKHMFLRLASSTAAAAETLGRHLRYVERAIRTGISTSRGIAMTLFGNTDELQLDLLDVLSSGSFTRVDVALLTAERKTLQALLDAIESNGECPKAQRLGELLRERHQGKTIVFTCAAATAVMLAARLGWDRVVVATGRGSRIASGSISLNDALDMFSPASRGAATPKHSVDARVLVTTDLASEGLNLQDADSVVHYDLPWNPMRLQQRLGRVRRLGSCHDRVNAFWFVPSRRVESHVAIGSLVNTKASGQVALGMPATTRVGRSVINDSTAAMREAMCLEGNPDMAATMHVVRGAASGVFGLRWEFSRGVVYDVMAATPEDALDGPDTVRRLISALRELSPSDRGPDQKVIARLHSYVRGRTRTLQSRPQRSLGLGRAILRVARAAGKARDKVAITRLDSLLDALAEGVPVGFHREIESWLAAGAKSGCIPRPKRRYGPGAFLDVKLLFALVSDGIDSAP